LPCASTATFLTCETLVPAACTAHCQCGLWLCPGRASRSSPSKMPANSPHLATGGIFLVKWPGSTGIGEASATPAGCVECGNIGKQWTSATKVSLRVLLIYEKCYPKCGTPPTPSGRATQFGRRQPQPALDGLHLAFPDGLVDNGPYQVVLLYLGQVGSGERRGEDVKVAAATA
jgi:hypothetical protein